MTDIRLLFSTDIVQALKDANTPSAANPFATIADLGSSGIGGGGTQGFVPYFNPDGVTIENSGIFYDGINVGIGTLFPGRLLDVNGDARVNGSLFLSDLIEWGSGHGIGAGNYETGRDGTGDLVSNVPSGANQNFTIQGVSSLFLQTGGNVGIGIVVPLARLHVVGVDNTIANYAFIAQDNTLADLFAVYNSGQISAGDANSNLFMGIGSGIMITTGHYNTSFGKSSLAFNTNGASNSAFGFQALQVNTTGTSNTAIGYNSLVDNIAGTDNTAVGYNSQSNNVNNTDNTAIGSYSLFGNSSGYFCTAVGSNALRSTTGNSNTGIGGYTMYNNGAGIENTAVGMEALFTNNAGNGITALGQKAGYTSAASGGVFLGYQSGYFETGSNKLFIDNQPRTDEADGRVKALVYGGFDALTANQFLTVNGIFSVLETSLFSKVAVFGSGAADASSILEVASTTNFFRIKPMTAAQASAITPAEGDFAQISTTDATFTVVGIWNYQGGSWTQL